MKRLKQLFSFGFFFNLLTLGQGTYLMLGITNLPIQKQIGIGMVIFFCTLKFSDLEREVIELKVKNKLK